MDRWMVLFLFFFFSPSSSHLLLSPNPNRLAALQSNTARRSTNVTVRLVWDACVFGLGATFVAVMLD
jgi:hypothetical protein